MFFRIRSKSGAAVPAAQQALQDIHSQLRQQQQLWAEKLAQDPACFATLEQQVHLRFGQLAAHLSAPPPAGVPTPPPPKDPTKKKKLGPNAFSVPPTNVPAASPCWAA